MISSQTGDSTEPIESLTELTATDWIIAGAVFVGSIIVARLVASGLRRILRRTSLSEHGSTLLSRFVAYLIMVLGFVYALSSVNVPIGPLLGALGVAGIALAFAFQDILENLIAGFGMQIRRPLKPGDEVETNEFEGRVKDITLRTVVLTTFDGETVFLPNSSVWKNPLRNFTDTPNRRSTLVVGVAYDTDLEHATEVLEKAAASIEEVLESPSPVAQVTEFGESSIDFNLRYWTASPNATLQRVRDQVARSVKRHFDAAGIEIPFPQRVIHYGDSEEETTAL